jgi:hypothetical protein
MLAPRPQLPTRVALTPAQAPNSPAPTVRHPPPPPPPLLSFQACSRIVATLDNKPSDLVRHFSDANLSMQLSAFRVHHMHVCSMGNSQRHSASAPTPTPPPRDLYAYSSKRETSPLHPSLSPLDLSAVFCYHELRLHTDAHSHKHPPNLSPA